MAVVARRGPVTVPARAGRASPAGVAAHRSRLQGLGNRARGALLHRAAGRAADLVGGDLGHQPDPYVRAVLQTALGRDLGDVRVHSGTDAAAALDSMDSDGATRGHDVVLRPEHDHATTNGARALLLHELVHVLQQHDRPTLGDEGEPPPALEEEARAVATRLVGVPGRER